jgi:uncharacterized protein YdaU (DUF1376 family)
MSLDAQGAYVKLLCFMWADSDDQCSIIDSNDLLARAIGTTVEHWIDLRAEIQCASDPVLEKKSGRLVSVRLKHEALKQRKYRKLQSEKGEKSAQQRLNRGSTTVQPLYQPKGNSSSSSSVLNNKDTSNNVGVCLNGDREGFDIFWKAFPKKRNKGHAEKSWAKLRPDDLLLGLMLAKIEQGKETPEWKKEHGRFIPYPASWLNAKAWEDEYHAGIGVTPIEPVICLWKVPNTADRKSKTCGKAIAPEQHGVIRPFCEEHLTERQRVDAQLAIAEGQA